jgi:mannitol/fructose-specific phosphotransferase system IIA component (Ntr-type)
VVHLEALKQFSYLLGDKGMLEKIRRATDVDEVASVLKACANAPSGK